MNLTVNRLPAKTWNRLNMNQTTILDLAVGAAAPLPAGAPSARGPVPDDVWDTIETGMGRDLDELAAGASPRLLCAPDEGKEAGPAVIELTPGGQPLTRLYLYAAAGRTLDAVVLCRAGDVQPDGQGQMALQIKVLAEENAAVRLWVPQILDDGTTFLCDVGALCRKGATFALTRLELGGSRVYAGALAELAGDDSAFDTKIAYWGSGTRSLDMNYLARHHGRRTTSSIAAAGVLWDEAEKLFRGSIDFHRGCAGAQGAESEEVLLLGDEVVNRSIPLILCDEEDVEGAHGASIGALDDATLFYLMSRGLSAQQAEQLVARARIDALNATVPAPAVRQAVTDYLDQTAARRDANRAD